MNELDPVVGGARHCAEGSSSGTRISERPATHRNPRLKTLICVLQSGKSVVEIARAPVHRSNLEGRRVKKGEGEIDVGKAVKIQIFRGHTLAFTRVRPRLIVANGALIGTGTTTARRAVWGAAAPEALLASRSTEVIR